MDMLQIFLSATRTREASIPATGRDKFFLPQKRRAPNETRASLRGQGKFRRRRPDGRGRRAAAPAVPASR